MNGFPHFGQSVTQWIGNLCDEPHTGGRSTRKTDETQCGKQIQTAERQSVNVDISRLELSDPQGDHSTNRTSQSRSREPSESAVDGQQVASQTRSSPVNKTRSTSREPKQSKDLSDKPPEGNDDDSHGIGRREFIVGGSVLGAAGVGGYLFLSGDDSGRPDWTDWIPAKHVESETMISKIDTDILREEFPPGEYHNFLISDMPEIYGFRHEDMDELYALEVGNQPIVEVLTGRFDINEIASVADAELTGEEEAGFEIAEGQDGSKFAIREDVLIFGDEPRDAIASNSDEIESIGESDEDWNEILGAVGSPPLAIIGNHPYESIPFNIEIGGTVLEPHTDETVEVTIHYLFDSEASAESVLNNQRSELEEHFIDPADRTVESVDQVGRRLLVNGTEQVE